MLGFVWHDTVRNPFFFSLKKKFFGNCRYGVSPFTPLKGLFIQGPVFISFFLAVRLIMLPYDHSNDEMIWVCLWISLIALFLFQINNMAEKVPSFKGGGAYWFVDLTTPDPLYILPVLTGLTFLITVEVDVYFFKSC